MMQLLASIIMGAGLIVAIVGFVWLVLLAFQVGPLWGLGTILMPLVGIVFAVSYWDDVKVPFLVTVAGNVLMLVGMSFA